jgi:hypothetical protein
MAPRVSNSSGDMPSLPGAGEEPLLMNGLKKFLPFDLCAGVDQEELA